MEKTLAWMVVDQYFWQGRERKGLAKDLSEEKKPLAYYET